METVYALEQPQADYYKSIFLAGPTPRTDDVYSWRDDALKILETQGYDGVVFVPEPRDGRWAWDYLPQVQWEEDMLNMADRIVFWIPRAMDGMPGLTTNDEWGFWKDSGKCIFGAPDTAEHVRYQGYYAQKLLIPTHMTLEDTLRAAVESLGDGSLRVGPEREIPLNIWKTETFQKWYNTMQIAGNDLLHCKVLWSFRVGAKKDFTFLWAIQPEVYVHDEDRVKSNEVVISRTDSVSVVLYNHGDDDITRVVLVKEFRSPVRNEAGYVYECPGGTSTLSSDPRTVAAEEVHEETGWKFAPGRFNYVGDAQVAATVSAHHTQVFAVELTYDETTYFLQQEADGATHGEPGGEEITYIKVVELDDLLTNYAPVDWSTYGMIMKALEE